MKKINIFLIIAALIISSGVTFGTAHAGEIDGLFSDAEIYWDISTNTENNDNVSVSLEDLEGFFETYVEEGEINSSYNWVYLEKYFYSTDPIDVFVDVFNTEGTTEYLFVEAIGNYTGLTWTDYHLELGITDWDIVDQDGDGFIPLSQFNGGIPGLDFDTPDKDPTPFSFFPEDNPENGFIFNPIFSTVIHNSDFIGYYNGQIPPIGLDEEYPYDYAWLLYSMDIPDAFFEEFGNEGYEFTLRQYPTTGVIPEPSSMFLLGFGLLGAGFLRRRKRV